MTVKPLLAAAAATFFAGIGFAQAPLIYYRSVVNAASQMPAGLPGGTIAQGAIFSIAGANLGPANAPAPSDPPQTQLGGVGISITQGSTTLAATPVFVSPTSVQAILPSNAPLGLVSLRLSRNGVLSNPLPVQISTSAFGIFTANASGNGPASAQLVSPDDGSLSPLTLQTPAMPGQDVIITGTGLGPKTALSAVSVLLGGRSASLTQILPVDASPGQTQLQFTIPANTPVGCWVPIYTKVVDGGISNFATIAITADGSACNEPANPLASALTGGGNMGAYAAARIAVRHDAGVLTPIDAATDIFGAYQASEVQGPANFNPLFSLPPVGTCTAYAFKGDPKDPAVLIPGMTPPTGAALDAGTVSIASGTFTANAAAFSYPGFLASYLGGSAPSLSLSQLFLGGSGFTVSQTGGTDIGSTSIDSPSPAPFVWSNRDQILNISRSQGVSLTWTGGVDGANVFLAGYASDLPTNSGAGFVCMAPAGVGAFTVPPDVLANLPATRARAFQSRGAIYLGQWNLNNPLAVNLDGLDYGVLLSVYSSGKTVNFQ